MKILKKYLKHIFFYKYRNTRKLKREIMIWTDLDQNRLEFYSTFIQPGDLCFDIGANFGNRVKIFLKLGAKVVAVEPQNECIDFLKKNFSSGKNFIYDHKACGSKEEILPIYISNVNTLSSFSIDWINKVKKSGRFLNYEWQKRYLVDVTTLDQLINNYGPPKFIKIDVEGYEYEVLQGLTHPVPYISFEFIPEYISAAVESIKYLNKLGPVKLNYVLGNDIKFDRDQWLSPEEMIGWLSALKQNNLVNGDIYVKFD